MKRLLHSAIVFSVIIAGCETTQKQPNESDEIIVTATKRGGSAKETPPPPPPPPQMVTGWDGSVYTDLSQVPPPPVVTYMVCPDGSSTAGSCPVIGGAEQTSDAFANADPNPYKSTSSHPVSTFSADVDTASYSFVRQYIEDGRTPPPESVRVEEMVNYFDYAYERPTALEQPFASTISIVPTPWNADTKLMQIGLKGYEPSLAKRPDMNLVFLIDVSGSMNAENKISLLKRSFEILTRQLTKDDTIAIVTYASEERVALEPTRGDKTQEILAAIRGLNAHGSTAGQAGMQMAYEQAARRFKRNGTNRIIMATDGDFNVGISDPEELKNYVAEKRKEDIYLSVLGFGQGNLKDDRMQALAQNGNGVAAYIDSIREARKFFVNDMGKNLIPIANDLKLQIEFNPDLVSEYRLVGYETRALKREDFANDKVDAGDTGAGHSVTAIYEINPVGSKSTFVEPLRYASEKPEPSSEFDDEYAFLKIRYKKPGKDTSQLMTLPVTIQNEFSDIQDAPQSTRFATAVAAYGLKLKEDEKLDGLSWDRVAQLANNARGEDQFGYRSEFVELVRNIAAFETETVKDTMR